MAKLPPRHSAHAPASELDESETSDAPDSAAVVTGPGESAAAPENVLFVSVLLLLSGACALVYQVAWLREFHLVFGGSTAASGAVLSIFMAGLGLGNLVFGRRADRVQRPLALYGILELGIAASVACSPWLIDGIRSFYASTGGQSALGLTGATLLRLLLACVVMLLPTMLMGGTLPAAVRAVTDPRDTYRRSLALVYGMNTLGAVLGAGFSTFFLLETLGTRATLWSACLVNVALSVAALLLSRRSETVREGENVALERDRKRHLSAEMAGAATAPSANGPTPVFVYFAAAVVGFAFFLMEIVWYRMLAPLLGGTTFAFGIILMVALAGIGMGGLAWGPLSRRIRPTLSSFAVSCGLEALLIAVPFALGDRIAVYAAESRLQPNESFNSLVMNWISIASLVVLPAAIVSGLQFPLLVGLLGEGRNRIGRQVGQAFACNTIGAILGSLVGGFGLLPLLSANGVWSASVILLCTLGFLATVLEFRRTRRRLPAAAAVVIVGAAMACLFATGPTAVWRHGGIGAGRITSPGKTPNDRIKWMNSIRRRFVHEADGVEASVAIDSSNGYAFYVNGKSDGNSIGDAGSQIMIGVLPAWLHDNPQSALVVGLGTGESAGWLAEVQTIRQVDVVELEPAIDEMARLCAPVNFDVLNHPKVRRIYNDAREVLVTTPNTYDLIVSEPSNPYRAGIANLFTREFYQSVEHRLNEGGLFVQWIQAYEVDEQTIRTALATVDNVFGHVEIWQSLPEDLLLVCSREPLSLSESTLRERLKIHPFRDAAKFAWRAVDLEGVMSRYLAGDATVSHFAGSNAPLNTDDRNLIEYGFARTLGRYMESHHLAIRETAASLGDTRLNLPGVDWDRAVDHRQLFVSVFRGRPYLPPQPTAAQRDRQRLLDFYKRGDMRKVVDLWRDSKREPVFPTELSLVAIACADVQDDETLALLTKLEDFNKTEASAIRAFYYTRGGKFDKAAESIEQTCVLLRTDPWAFSHATELLVPISLDVATRQPAQARRIWQALEKSFLVSVYDLQRHAGRLELSLSVGDEAILDGLAAFEPYPIWEDQYLETRARAYRQAGLPLAERAEADLAHFRRNNVSTGR